MIMDICISEKRLEDYLVNHLSNKKIINGVGPEIAPVQDGCVYRQVSLGRYGIADIVTIDGYHGCDPTITIYELKKGDITHTALIQALRYYAGFKKFYERTGDYFQEDSLQCVLIGGSLSQQDDLHLAISTIPFLQTYTYDLCPNDGLTLCRQNWEANETHPPDTASDILTKFNYDTHDLDAILYNYEKGGR